MVRHIHMDVIRARAATMAAELGVDHELVVHQLAEAHMRMGRVVEVNEAVRKHYADGRLISVKPMFPVQRFVGHLAVPAADFKDTVQV